MKLWLEEGDRHARAMPQVTRIVNNTRNARSSELFQSRLDLSTNSVGLIYLARFVRCSLGSSGGKPDVQGEKHRI